MASKYELLLLFKRRIRTFLAANANEPSLSVCAFDPDCVNTGSKLGSFVFILVESLKLCLQIQEQCDIQGRAKTTLILTSRDPWPQKCLSNLFGVCILRSKLLSKLYRSSPGCLQYYTDEYLCLNRIGLLWKVLLWDNHRPSAICIVIHHLVFSHSHC